MNFQVLPAIDLMDGGCVRLQQGDANKKTLYEKTPRQVAAEYQASGVQRIHVVDLDGAFAGVMKNRDALRDIRNATTAEIEVGGGIRDHATVDALLDMGINYVVLGTKALEDTALLRELVRAHGNKIIVGADARNGFLSTRGWTRDTTTEAVPYLKLLHEELGVKTVIFTDIARDGMFTAPNMEALVQVLEISPQLDVIASGGVGTIDHISALRKLNRPNLIGVIVGKAIYDGRVSLPDAIAAAASAA